MTEREQFEAALNAEKLSGSPVYWNTYDAMFWAWNAARSADEALMREAMEALEFSAKRMPHGLEHSAYDKAHSLMHAALEGLRARLAKEGETT